MRGIGHGKRSYIVSQQKEARALGSFSRTDLNIVFAVRIGSGAVRREVIERKTDLGMP